MDDWLRAFTRSLKPASGRDPNRDGNCDAAAPTDCYCHDAAHHNSNANLFTESNYRPNSTTKSYAFSGADCATHRDGHPRADRSAQPNG